MSPTYPVHRGLAGPLGLVGAGAALAVGLLAPFEAPADVQLVIAVFGATVLLWMTRPVPYAVSSLLAVMLLYGLGIVDSFPAAVSGFASTLVFFFILILLIGASVSAVDLDQWVANRIVSATSTPRTSIARLATAILLIGFVMPSALARTATFLPVVDRINALYELDDDSPFRRLGYFVVGHLNPMASMAVMTGGATPILTAELINTLVRPITWAEWAAHMVVPVTMGFAGATIIAAAWFRVGDTVTIDLPEGRDREEAAFEGNPEPLERDQLLVIALLGLAIVAWIAGSFLGVPAVVPAMGVVLVLALPGVRIVTVDDFAEINWGIIFLLGAMLSLVDAMSAVNAFEYVVIVTLEGMQLGSMGWLMLFVLLGFALAVRAMFSAPAPAIAILLPIMLEFVAVLGLDGVYVSWALMLVLNIAVFLPIHGPPVLLAYDTGPLSMAEVAMLGVLNVAVTLAVIAFSWLVYWPFVGDVVGGVL